MLITKLKKYEEIAKRANLSLKIFGCAWLHGWLVACMDGCMDAWMDGYIYSSSWADGNSKTTSGSWFCCC